PPALRPFWDEVRPLSPSETTLLMNVLDLTVTLAPRAKLAPPSALPLIPLPEPLPPLAPFPAVESPNVLETIERLVPRKPMAPPSALPPLPNSPKPSPPPAPSCRTDCPNVERVTLRVVLTSPKMAPPRPSPPSGWLASPLAPWTASPRKILFLTVNVAPAPVLAMAPPSAEPPGLVPKSTICERLSLATVRCPP